MAKKSAKKPATHKKKGTKKPATTTKKSVAPETKMQKEHFTDSPFFFVGVILLLMLSFAIVAYFVTVQSTSPGATPASVLVTVNGEPITQHDVDFQHSLLPPQYEMDKDQILEQLINEKLVLQAAHAEGMEATLEEVQAEIQSILSSSGISISDLSANLEAYNVTMDDFEALVQRQLVIQEYSNAHVTVEEPTDAELKVLYDAQIDSFSRPEQARVRHILISNQREDAAVVAKDLYDRVRAGEDFCELVSSNTDDKGSKETCGEYTFPRGMMVPEFETASFEMANGEFRMVTTQFGYHIIEKLAQIAPGVQPFAEVKDSLVDGWMSTARAQAYSDLLESLRAGATIVYAGDEAQEMPAAADAPAEMAAAQPENDSGAETAVRIVHTDDEVKDCIAERSVLYGADWSGDTAAALELFAGTGISYVACDVDSATCSAAGVTGYPTWEIDDTLYPGRKTLEELSTLTGCA